MKLNCEFRKGICAIYLNKYTCVVTSSAIVRPNTRVNGFIGAHLPGRCNSDVEAIKFEDTTVEHFPRGLHKVFPSLTSLFIRNCGLKSISRRDLSGLENLTGLGIFSNQLTSLPSNLLTNMRRLKNISFVGNKLENVSSQLLVPVRDNDLTYVDFRKNERINSVFGFTTSCYNVDSLEQLMKIIDTNCKQPAEDEQHLKAFVDKFSHGFKELWTTGQLSDFTIVAGSREFRVHKNVLSIQSAVFAAIFENDEDESNVLRLDEFSANVVEQFLSFLYTGDIPDGSNALELFAISCKFEVDELKDISEEMILDNLGEANAYEVFTIGHLFSSDNLKSAAFDEIKSLFPGTKLPEYLVNRPENVKELIDAKLNYDSVLQGFKKVE